MTGVGSIQLSAAIAAAACLLCPLIGRLIIKWQEPEGWRRPLHPALVILTLCIIAGAIMLVGWGSEFARADALFVAVLSLALGFGLTGERFAARRAVKVTVQIVLAAFVAVAGIRLPVTAGAYPALDAFCTVLLIIGLLNLLVVLNFLTAWPPLSSSSFRRAPRSSSTSASARINSATPRAWSSPFRCAA